MLLCSAPDAVPDRLAATDVKDLLLRLGEVEPAAARTRPAKSAKSAKS